MKSKAVYQVSGIRESISRGLVNSLQNIYLGLRKDRKQWETTKQDLKNMPSGSLGNDVYLFINEHEFELIPKAEFHDVYHVLLGYGTSIKHESMIQCLLVGNGRSTLPSLACTMVSVMFFPEHWGSFKNAYLIGREANVFHNWSFEELLLQSTSSLRDQIFRVNN